MSTSTLKEKLDDFAQYALTAFTHNEQGLHADALTNMRKCGEAAAKLVFMIHLPAASVKRKTEGKTFNDLIKALRREGIVDRPFINALETIQIHGNQATHDNRINWQQSDYGIQALRLLCHEVYEQHVKTLPPESLSHFLTNKIPDSEAEIESETEKANQLENEIKRLESERDKMLETDKKYENDLASSNAAIRGLTAQLEETNRKLLQLEENNHQRLSSIPTPKKKLPSANRLFAAKWRNWLYAAVVFIFSLGIFLIYTIGNEQSGDKPTMDETTAILGATYKIGILPFAVLEDNPMMKIDIEVVLRNELAGRFEKSKLPIQIILVDSVSPTTDFKLAADLAHDTNLDLVFFADFFESTGSEPYRINIKHVSVKDTSSYESGETGVRQFHNLSDSMLTSIFNELDCDIRLIYANKLLSQGQLNDVAKLTQSINPQNRRQEKMQISLLAHLYFEHSNYTLAGHWAKKLVKLTPNSADAHYFLGKIQSGLRQMDSAKHSFNKAMILQPTNIEYAIRYAFMIASINSQAQEAKDIALRYLKSDSSFAYTWFTLGLSELTLKNYKPSAKHLIKALELDSSLHQARFMLVNLYVDHLQEFALAETQLNLLQEFGGDKNTIEALRITIRPKKMLHELSQGGKVNPFQPMAMDMFANKKFQPALDMAKLVLQSEKENQNMLTLAGLCYYELGQSDSTLRYLRSALSMSPSSSSSAFSLGTFFNEFDSKHKNADSAYFYYRMAVRNGLTDTDYLRKAAKVFITKDDDQTAIEAFERIKQAEPNDYLANMYLGKQYVNAEQYVQASRCFEKAVYAHPKDYYAHIEYAACQLALNPPKRILALKHSTIAYGLNPKDALVLWIHAQSLFWDKRYSEAEAVYQDAIRLQPGYKNQRFEADLQKNL